MTVTGAGQLLHDRASALTFDRTVPRREVHRWALSEVFLTDVRADPDGGYAAGAQLPESHVYFGDHLPAVDVDSVLLLECARQAATCIAHRHLGVPHDSMFLVAAWSFELPDKAFISGGTPAGLSYPATDPSCGRLVMAVAVTPQVRSGVVRGAQFEVCLDLDGTAVGAMTITARYTPADEAALVRRYHRKTAPPSSVGLPAVPHGVPLEPRRAGRTRKSNIVLYNADIDAAGLRARLGTRPSHRSFYDHPQDHYPAMILLEAARQAAVTLAPRPARITGYRATFTRFAELDAPVLVTASAPARTPSGHQQVRVTFTQDDTVLNEMDVRVGANGYVPEGPR